MNIKILNEKAKIPLRANNFAAGYDIFSLHDYYVYPNERTVVKTGVAMEIPDGYYGQISPRSGLAVKNGIHVMAGVIDSDYRGEIGVILYNSDKEKTLSIRAGDRIAQIIFEKYYTFDFNVSDKLSDTDRSSSGFGSTGV
jgi:dUTP pyrophosphatase